MKEIGSSIWVLALVVGTWSTFWPGHLITTLTMKRVPVARYSVLALRVSGVLMLVGGLTGALQMLLRR